MEGQGQGREGQGLNLWDCVEDGKALLRSCCLCVGGQGVPVELLAVCTGRQSAPAELLPVCGGGRGASVEQLSVRGGGQGASVEL